MKLSQAARLKDIMMLEMKDLEEMQTVWNAQDNKHVFSLNQEAVHAIVLRKARCIEKGIDVVELLMPAMLIFVATVFGAKAAYRGDLSTTQMIAVGMTFLVAVVSACSIFQSRKRRKQNRKSHSQTLLGDLDRAIESNEYQIARLKSFQWWFMLPMLFMSLLNFVARGLTVAEVFSARQAISWSALLGSLLLGFAAVAVEIRWVHLRRRRDLQALRKKLAE